MIIVSPNMVIWTPRLLGSLEYIKLKLRIQKQFDPIALYKY